jgi:RNA polymerase sigma-70 factor (ECF subfamily)
VQSVETVQIPSEESMQPPGIGDPDALLVSRVQQDPAAFAELYRRYLNPIYAYCWRRLDSREAAEDATSQVFLKALGALPRYRGDHTFRSWLFTIAHNVVVDHYRAQRPDRPLTEAIHVTDHQKSPEEIAVLSADAAAMRAMPTSLTPDQARVIELRLAGLSEVEIAQVLNRRPGSVRATQFRALGRLRTLLGTSPGLKGDGHV